MRAMKDSGVEWIGEIPEGWSVAPLKVAIQWKSEKGQPDAEVLSLYRDYGILPKDSRDDNHNVTSLDTGAYKVVSVGDLVVNKMKAWQGSLAVSTFSGIVSPAYHVCKITSSAVNKKYLHYLLRNQAYLPEYTRLSTGMRVGQWDLGFDDFKNIPFLLPPPTEQQRIAAYLDEQCGEIDKVLAKTRESIEEYKKLKQSVITEAVTKGIRPNRPMKPSGIEWIGDIPAEWEVVKLKRLAKIETGNTPPKNSESIFFSRESGYLWIKAENLGSTKSIEETTEYLTEEGIKHGRLFPAHSVFVCCIASVGKVGFCSKAASCNQQINALSFTNAHWKYGFYLTVAQETEYLLYASGNVMKIINSEKQSNLMCPLPQLAEQAEIVAYLDQQCAEIDRLIAKKEQIITELESYKKSLIYECVTGKREVE